MASKQTRIAVFTSEVDGNLKKLAQLQREGELVVAKEPYVAQAEQVMLMIREIKNDKKFQDALKIQFKQILKKVSKQEF